MAKIFSMRSSVQTSTAWVQPRFGFRPELQGLRALAVGLVLLYHLWPAHVSGGFVGVDVFFVISGFLITSHIFRQIRDTGTIQLAKFWARRIMRLLPLALLVIAVSAVTLFWFMPETVWSTNARHMLGSVFYVENWLLAGDSVEYSARDNQATMVQHYWSLSVEEQFYVFMPLVLAATAWLFRKKIVNHDDRSAATLVLTTLAVLGVTSLVFSIYYTQHNPSAAYFITPTRLWEFTIGGMIAVVPWKFRMPVAAQNLVSWAGIAMIAIAGLSYSEKTAFPGFSALLPTIGAALFILCGTATRGWGAHWWFSLKPIVRLGDWSYAIYLWHWPIIIVASTLMPQFLWPHKIVVVIATIMLSWASQRWVEDPLRFTAFFKAPRAAVTFMAAAMIIAGGGVFITESVAMKSLNDNPVANESECVGANAMFNDCTDVTSADPEIAPALVTEERTDRPFPDCDINDDPAAESSDPQPCSLGVDEADAVQQVAIFGDSHARSWLPMVDEVAQEHGWAVTGYIKPACSPIDVGEKEETGTADEVKKAKCSNFAHHTAKILEDDDELDLIIMSVSPRNEKLTDDSGRSTDQIVDEAYRDMWQRWEEAGKQVMVIGEVPRFDDQPIPDCLAENAQRPAAKSCSQPLDKLMDARRANLAEAAREMDSVPIYDPRPGICDEENCYGLVGGLVAYYDTSHLTEDFAKSFKPNFEQFLIDNDLVEVMDVKTAGRTP